MNRTDLFKEHKSFSAQCPMCQRVVNVAGHPFFGQPARGDFVVCDQCRSFLAVVSLHPLRLELQGANIFNRPDSFLSRPVGI